MDRRDFVKLSLLGLTFPLESNALANLPKYGSDSSIISSGHSHKFVVTWFN